MLAIYTGGIAWLDEAMKSHYHADFLTAKAEQKTEMLDKIAYRKNRTAELAPGIKFFDWARRMTVDAYYTSAAGIKEVGYMGNRGDQGIQGAAGGDRLRGEEEPFRLETA